MVNQCWLIQLFSLACTIKGYTKRRFVRPPVCPSACLPACHPCVCVCVCHSPAEQQSSKQCELPSDEAGIIWDGVCFCFLLLQRRVFRSHYFLYVVLDLQNTQLLASRYTHTHTHSCVRCLCLRGAELIEAATVKAVRARLEVEKMSMDLLKRQ